MSAIFLLPVCLTYWPRKYTTRVDPHVDNSHQVWSWYDHPLPSYSVFVCWYVTWPGDLDLEQLSYMAGHVTNPATVPPSLKTLRLFVHELRVITVPIAYHWKCVRDHCWQVHRNGYLWTSGVNLDTAVRFDDPDFLVRVQNFGNLAMFSVDFCILYAECPPFFYFRFVWPRKYTTCVDPHVDNSHQVWSPYADLFLSYEW